LDDPEGFRFQANVLFADPSQRSFTIGSEFPKASAELTLSKLGFRMAVYMPERYTLEITKYIATGMHSRNAACVPTPKFRKFAGGTGEDERERKQICVNSRKQIESTIRRY